MEILGFLFGLGCLVVIAWAITLQGHIVVGCKHQQRKRPLDRSPSFRRHFSEILFVPRGAQQFSLWKINWSWAGLLTLVLQS